MQGSSEQGTSNSRHYVLREQVLPGPNNDESRYLEISKVARPLLLANLKTHELCSKISEDFQIDNEKKIHTASGHFVGDRRLVVDHGDQVLGQMG